MAVREFVICDICGEKGARVRHVTRSHGHGTDLLVIEKVPVITCPHCGESYLTGVTLHELKRIKRQRKKLSSMRPVAVANFQ